MARFSPQARPGAGGGRRAGCTSGCRSSPPSGSGTSSTRSIVLDVPSEALWFVVRTGWPRSSCPSFPGWPSSRTRSTVTRTCWRTRWRWWTRRRPDRDAAAGRAVPRRGQAADEGHHRRWGELPPPRGRGRADDADADGGAALLGRRSRHRGPPGRAPPALPHVPPRLDRQGGAPLRARRRRPTGAAERVDPVRLHDPQRQQGASAGAPDGRAGGGASPSCGERGGARRPAPRPRRATR